MLKRLPIAFVALALAAIGSDGAKADNIGIPGFGDLTPFASGNVAMLIEDGKLGIASNDKTDIEAQNVNSLIGADWLWDVGYSHKLLGHVEFFRDYVRLDETFDSVRMERGWLGFSNIIGTVTFGRQPLAFRDFYGSYIDQAQEIYATGYTTPFAGGLEVASDIFKLSSSIGRFQFGVDFKPSGLDRSSPVGERYGVAAQYVQWLSRISFTGAFDREELRAGGHVNRAGFAARYGAEQWSVALGVHHVDDPTPHDTTSYNALAILQLTEDNQLHLSLSVIDDKDIYDGFLGAGFYIDHKIGSQLRFYGEGAATRVEDASGGKNYTNANLLIGIRYDYGNVWY